MVKVELLRALAAWAETGAEIRALSSVTSTNDVAWAWAEAGCPEWTTVLAEEQVQGRGRFGRTWQCPRGRGVLMSVVFRPRAESDEPAHLTALGALAVAEAVEESLPRAMIRWPNDVVVGGRKIAGVLVERRGADPSGASVMGVGLNVNVAREDFPEALRATATSLAAETGREMPIEHAAAAVLRRLRARYREAADGRWSGIAAAWRERSELAGATVDVEAQGEVVRGRVVAADPFDGLELELDGGGRRRFRADRATVRLPEPG